MIEFEIKINEKRSKLQQKLTKPYWHKTKEEAFKIMKGIWFVMKTNKTRQDIKKSRYKIYKYLSSVLQSKCPETIKSDDSYQKQRKIHRRNMDYKTEVILCYHFFKTKFYNDYI